MAKKEMMMRDIADLIHVILPLISLLLLIIGIKNSYKNYVALALWVNILTLIIHYQIAGAQIFGSYFNYLQALLHSISLLTLLTCIIYLIFSFESKGLVFRYLLGFFAAISSVGIGLLLINLWVNAWFIEHRMPGTPILQVAQFKRLDYCSYRYVFYKVSDEGSLKFMCPNHYGLIPSIGSLKTTPDFILRQLPANLQNKFKNN